MKTLTLQQTISNTLTYIFYFVLFVVEAMISVIASSTYQKSLISSYTSYTSITNPLYIGLCVVRDGWEMCRIGALFNKILTLFCTTICFLFTPLHSLTEQSVALQSLHQGGARGGSSTHWNILFHPMEQLIPPVGTTYSTHWNNWRGVLYCLSICFAELKLKSFNSRHCKIAKGDHSKFNTQRSTFALFFS